MSYFDWLLGGTPLELLYVVVTIILTLVISLVYQLIRNSWSTASTVVNAAIQFKEAYKRKKNEKEIK